MNEIQPLLDWVSQHAAWGYVVVFTAAFLDSLVLVGLIVPGIALLFGLGTLAGLGIFDLTWTLFFAFLGAVCGDVFSFYLGRHYHENLYRFRIFRQNKEWLHKAHLFFKHHGAKSIVIGRFIGPMRATLPTVAGMLNMPTGQFLGADISSGIAWALVYVLPGALLGSSLQATEQGARIAMLIGALLAFIALGAWSSYYAWAFSKRFFVWLGHTLSKVPQLHFFHTLTKVPTMGMLFFLGITFFSLTLFQLLTDGMLVHLSQSLLAFLQTFKNASLLPIAVILTQLGEDAVLLLVGSALLLWLVLQKQYKVAFCVLGALGSAVTATTLLKYGLKIPRPSVESLTTAYSFPSGHATHSTVLWGYFFYLFAKTIQNRIFKKSLCALTVALIIFISLSRVYLEVHWLIDVIGGVTLGVTILSSFILLQHHLAPAATFKLIPKMKTLTLAALLVLLFVHQGLTHQKTTLWYQSITVDPYKLIAAPNTQQRYGLLGPSPETFNMYFRGSLTLLIETLSHQGWKSEPKISFPSLIDWAKNWKGNGSWLESLPTFPRFHRGLLSCAILTKQETKNTTTLYIWPDYHAKAEEQAWVGLVKKENGNFN